MTTLSKREQTAIDYIRRTYFSPHAKAWLVEHLDYVPPEHGGDQTKNAIMMALHFIAISKGIKVDSKKYYKFLDDHIGEKINV